MAGDWIKMRTSLLTNPKVNGIAKALESNTAVTKSLAIVHNCVMSQIVTRNVMRHVTVSSLLVIWGAANEHTFDGVFENSELSDIDDMTGIPGFGEAMESVGWLEYDVENHTVTLPNFNEYNTSSSERTAGAKSGAQRQKEYRDRKSSQNKSKSDVTSDVTRNVTNDVTRNHREEKRREEVNLKNLTNPNGLVVASDADNPPEGSPEISKASDCPHQKIIALYHEILPQCPAVREWTPARAVQLRARWNEDPARQNMEYWRRFFEYVKTCDFLVGIQPDSRKTPFFADLEWLVKQANFTKVREGKYEPR